MIETSEENRTTVFSVVIKVLQHKNQTILPNIINTDKDMAYCFNNFFQNKLNIHDGFPSSNLLSPITKIINKLLSLGVFPRSMKPALVKLLIKKLQYGL